jgi:decaprenylphospho-beta-D-ribofuranose 2-oxidase
MKCDANIRTFDRTEEVTTALDRPESYATLEQIVKGTEHVIARGAGLSYSAASFGAGTLSVDMTRFDRVLAYDPDTGNIVVEAGLRVGDLLAMLGSRRRYLPALPGYPDITVGGCVAFDVHGKSQVHTGNFGDWVEALRLIHRDHGEIVCSRSSNPEVFDLTIGGLGLTGIVTQVTLRTAALTGNGVSTNCVRVRNLIEASELMRAEAGRVDTLYSWHNMNLRGTSFGRGVVYLERFVDEANCRTGPRRRLVSCRSQLPARTWNRLLTGVTQRLYDWAQPVGETRLSGLHEAAFPIEGKEIYYAAFGRQGFREYQVIVPFDRWAEFAQALDKLLARARIPVALGSLKLFRGARRALRFRADGVCLAIDIPAVAAACDLFSEVDRLTVTAGGVANLSKDSRLGARSCEAMFGEYADFRKALKNFDPIGRHQSRLRESVGV